MIPKILEDFEAISPWFYRIKGLQWAIIVSRQPFLVSLDVVTPLPLTSLDNLATCFGLWDAQCNNKAIQRVLVPSSEQSLLRCGNRSMYVSPVTRSCYGKHLAHHTNNSSVIAAINTSHFSGLLVFGKRGKYYVPHGQFPPSECQRIPWIPITPIAFTKAYLNTSKIHSLVYGDNGIVEFHLAGGHILTCYSSRVALNTPSIARDIISCSGASNGATNKNNKKPHQEQQAPRGEEIFTAEGEAIEGIIVRQVPYVITESWQYIVPMSGDRLDYWVNSLQMQECWWGAGDDTDDTEIQRVAVVSSKVPRSNKQAFRLGNIELYKAPTKRPKRSDIAVVMWGQRDKATIMTVDGGVGLWDGDPYLLPMKARVPFCPVGYTAGLIDLAHVQHIQLYSNGTMGFGLASGRLVLGNLGNSYNVEAGTVVKKILVKNLQERNSSTGFLLKEQADFIGLR